MADDSHSIASADSATSPIVVDDCRLCGGDGFVLPLDGCPRCAAIAEADWRQMQREAGRIKIGRTTGESVSRCYQKKW